MNKILNYIVMLAIILIAASCTGKVSRKELKKGADSIVEVSPQYAKGFTVRMLDNGIRLVDVKDPQKAKGMT